MKLSEKIQQDKVSLRDLINWGEQQLLKEQVFFGHGTDNALDEAAWIISHALGLPVDFADDELDKLISVKKKTAVLASIKRRIESRLPTAYITNEAWFAGYPFYVDDRVLVPRSPIAELILHHFHPWVGSHSIANVLDLCCGSGCIGIATALTLPEVKVDCTDVSDEALAVARLNVSRHQVDNRVKVIKSDLFAKISNRTYDLILCNPPYVDAGDMAALPEEYKKEPKLGLAAGEDGLTLVIPILKQAARHLNKGGIIIVEVGNSETALVNRFSQLAFTWLEFESGGHGVFLLSKEELDAANDYLNIFN